MSDMTIWRLLNRPIAHDSSEAQLASIAERLDRMDAHLAAIRRPKPAVHWTVTALIVAITAVGIYGLVNGLNMSSSSSELISLNSTHQQDLITSELISTHLELQGVNFEVDSIEFLQQGNVALATQASANSVRVIEKAQKNDKDLAKNGFPDIDLASAFNQESHSILLVSICSLLLGGIVGYFILSYAEISRRFPKRQKKGRRDGTGASDEGVQSV